MTQHIDYTARRLGTKTPDGKIVVCAKCSQRGASKRLNWARRPRIDTPVWRECVIHEKHMFGMAWHVDRYCMIVPVAQDAAS